MHRAPCRSRPLRSRLERGEHVGELDAIAGRLADALVLADDHEPRADRLLPGGFIVNDTPSADGA